MSGYSPCHFRRDIEVTPREVLFSVLIVGVLYTIGFFIAGAIEKHAEEQNLKYRQAVQIKDNGLALAHACNTDVGYAFVEGDFHTVDPVSFEGLEGEHLRIVRDKEEYTRHTRVETYTVPNGRGGTSVRTRTVTFWTWDVVSSSRKCATKILCCSNEYPVVTFSFGDIGTIRRVKETGFRTRDVFYYLPKDFRGAFFCKLAERKINGRPLIIQGATIEGLYNAMIKSPGVIVFWCFWWILIAGCVIAFVVIDNKWLEDRGD